MDIKYELRRVARKLLWDKCDICGKAPAYFEYYEFGDGELKTKKPILGIDGWIYVCWECAITHNLECQGSYD